MRMKVSRGSPPRTYSAAPSSGALMLGSARSDWNTSAAPPGVVTISMRRSVAPSLFPTLPNEDVATTTSATGIGASSSVMRSAADSAPAVISRREVR